MISVDALATPLEAFFNIFFVDTHTHRQEGIALPLLRIHAWGNYLASRCCKELRSCLASLCVISSMHCAKLQGIMICNAKRDDVYSEPV